jgi:tripartite-type tricarboxylate transporter receptor subunit TctC
MKGLPTFAVSGALFLMQVLSPAFAQEWPTRPIRLVVAFAAGGSSDITARVFAENLRPLLGQPVIVDNRAGASGTIATDLVAKATPNGYTLLVASATLLVNQSLYKNLPYDFLRDLAPISQTYSSNNLLVIHPKVPANNLAEFIAYVKSGKGVIHYGTAGHGSSQHLAAALFNYMVHGNMVHVPYKGGGPAIIDLVGGSIETIFSPLIESLPHVRAGSIKALGLCGLKRSALLPNVPTINEFLPGYQSTSWSGLFAPVKTPAPIVNRLNEAIVKVVNQPNVRAHMAEGDKEPVTSSPAEFRKFLEADAERLKMQVKISGAKME